MVVNPTPEQIKQKANDERLEYCKTHQDETKEKLLDELRKESLSVITLAYGYAKNFAEMGLDVTEKWITVEQQTQVLEQVYQRAYAEGVIKGREVEGKALQNKLEVQKNRVDDDYDYFDDGIGQSRVSGALRNMVQPTNVQRHGKGKRKRHKR